MKKYVVVLMVVFGLLLMPMGAVAGVKMKIGDDTSVDLGFRLQTQFIVTDEPETKEDFRLRRARFRLKANVTKWFTMFLQTESGGPAGSGYDMRIIDAWTSLHICKGLNLIMGQNMVPAGRQITTSSGALLCVDRPAINTFNLTWGVNAKQALGTANYATSNLGLTNNHVVRDDGATLFGAHSFNDTTHIKYYLGVYDGIDNTGEDSERYAARVQFNLFDKESGYFNLSNYVGKKKTLAMGVSVDMQDNIAEDLSQGDIDYFWWSFDLFAEYPVGDGVLTAEAGFINLDLDDAQFLVDGSNIRDARKTQGNGWYLQAGYLLSELKLQPWASFESWESDGFADSGSFTNWRLGFTYFVKGHNANIKVGFENFEPDGHGESELQTFLVGFYITY